jgi:iron complex transport system ATP-binding protein
MSTLEIQNLSIGYKKHTIQQDLNLQVSPGELICLIGTNGCGKSTLIRTLCGLQKPLRGNIVHDRKDIRTFTSNERALQFSFVLTEKIEVDNFSVFELVFTGRYPHTSWLGNRTRTDFEKTNEAIEMVHLTHKKDTYINELSDGEKQRAFIAKALAQDTPFIFLDEPTAHLDLPNRIEIMLLLRRLVKETNKAIVISTHELDLAMQTADHLWLMTEKGILSGAPNDPDFRNQIELNFATEAFEFCKESGSIRLRFDHLKI